MNKTSKVARQLLITSRVVTAVSIPSFSRFVKEYEVEDYPYGRERTKAIWKVESKGMEQRVCRITFDPISGRPNKPKCTTLAPVALIGVAGNGFAYPITGRPGQIAVWSGDMKHTLAGVFPDDSGYNELADALGFRRVPSSVTVKETREGALIDGLQGKTTTPREIMNLAGLPNEVIDAEVLKITRKQSKDFMKNVWIVNFKPEVDKKPFVIEVYA